MEVSSKIEVGQRIVYKGDMANASGDGAVVAIRANGIAGRMYSMNFGSGKLEPIDSSVSIDIALDDGRMMRGVYASNIGGEFGNKSRRFMLAEGKSNAAEIASLLAGVAIRSADLKAKAEAAAAVFAEAMEACKAAGLAIGLVPEADFKGRGSAAASNMRAELKAAGIKASVKQDGYSAINVKVDAADLPKAEAICRKYKAGSFDGMDDCYKYDPSAFGKVFGDVQYVFVRRAA